MEVSDAATIERDFAPFADPFEPSEWRHTSTMSQVSMARSGRRLDVRVHHSDGRVVLLDAGSEERFESVRSLFASRNFANLVGFVEHQKRSLQSDRGHDRIIRTDFDVNGERRNWDSTTAFVRRWQPKSAIRLVAIDGPAGMGKTFFLKHLALRSAEAFAAREVGGVPLLHVPSRGRQLRSLPDVIAKTTQTLRADFTFDQVPVLVRRGLLMVAIDGFDELVEEDGYKDAWRALDAFLEEIRGDGPECAGTVLLAGRDTFFNQQSLVERLTGREWIEVDTVRIREVEPEQADRFLKETRSEWQDRPSFVEDLLKPGSYALRPYFLEEMSKLDPAADLSGHTIRQALFGGILRREVADGKLPAILPDDELIGRLEGIYEEMASDMVDRQSDFVDLDYLELLVDVTFEGCDERVVRKLRERIGSLVLLEEDPSGPRLRRFPHEQVLHYFLSKAIVRDVTERGELPPGVRRGVLSADFFEVFLEEIQNATEETASTFAERCRAIVESGTTWDRTRENGAGLLLTSLGCPTVEIGPDSALRDLNAQDVCLNGTAPSATLRDSTIVRLDARAANLSRLVLDDVQITRLDVDDATRFGAVLPAVRELVVWSPSGTVLHRNPDQIEGWLRAHQTTPSRNGELPEDEIPLVQLLDRVCRKMQRQHVIRPGADDHGAVLLGDPLWHELEALLGDRLERTYSRQAAGPKSQFVRVRDPMGLVSPSENDVESRGLRDRIVARGRELMVSSPRRGT